MKIQEVTIITKRVVQMRQFEPAEYSVAIKAQVDPGEKVEQVMYKLKRMAREEVEEEAERLKRIRLESYEDEKEKSA